MQSFAVSVLPAPLSPEMSTDCGLPLSHIPTYALCTTVNICGFLPSWAFPSAAASAVMRAIVSGAHASSRLNGLTAMRIGPIDVYTSSRPYRCRSV